jgi:Ribbon-helix-helix protein, copG family
MPKQDKTVFKNPRGRPAGIKYAGTIPARFEIETMKTLDAWAKKRGVNRSEAIRRLVELGFTVRTPARTVSKPGRRSRAHELATKTIEKIIDPAAPPEEQAQRRRRLTKGPEEFREARVDRPKAKGK